MFEDLIAYAAVVCAAMYAGWRLLPASTRFSLAEHTATLALGLGFAKADPEALRRRAAARSESACGGGCSGCASKQGAQPVRFINKRDL